MKKSTTIAKPKRALARYDGKMIIADFLENMSYWCADELESHFNETDQIGRARQEAIMVASEIVCNK
jgi:hypothetical protein